VLHLPVIVEAAESSPAAAALAAAHIRKYLAQGSSARPHMQYNAVMLLRILTDNPGPTFTRNVDSKFVSTVKDVLRNSRDPSVQQIMRETLSAMYREKAYDNNLQLLFQMWVKEGGAAQVPPPPPGPPQGGWGPPGLQQPSSHARSRRSQRSGGLPPPEELAQRVEEARTSAKLLQQLVASTPQAELRDNELIREFADRCQAAQRSVQGYVAAEGPQAPDDDTMQTLIETAELLSLALSKHSRALLQARRAANLAAGVGSGGTNSPDMAGTPPPTSVPTMGMATMSLGGGGPVGPATAVAPPDAPGLAPLPPLPPPIVVPAPSAADGTHTSATYSPTGHSPGFPTYAPPPLPPTSVARKDVGEGSLSTSAAIAAAYVGGTTYSPPPLPPASHMPPPEETAADDDPFGDAHATTAPDVDAATAAAAAVRPVTPPASLRPGLPTITASSYGRRQDDAQSHATMHGGLADGVVDGPVSPESAGGARVKGMNNREISPVRESARFGS
jgi:hypothetical protein